MPHYRKNMTIFLMYSKGMSTLASSRVMFSNLLLVKRINSEINIYCKKVLKISLHMNLFGIGQIVFFSQILTGYRISGFFLPDIRLDRIPDFTTIRPDSSFDFLSIFPDDFFLSEIKNTIRRDTGYPAGNRISGFQNINFSAGSRQSKITIRHNPKIYCFVLK